jgi:hypothetical protein
MENIEEYRNMLDSIDSNSILNISLIITFIFIGIIVFIKIIGIIFKIKQRKKDDLKLQGYFEKYSDIIVDKVVEKINQNKKI